MPAWMKNRYRVGAAASLALFLGAPAASAQPVPVEEKELQKLARDPKVLDEAKKKYAQVCAACHGPEGQGLVGPNLTDGFWIKGNSPQAIADSIAHGNPAKGMPGMTPMIGVEGVKQLTAYVLTMKGKNLPGKGPEGKEYK